MKTSLLEPVLCDETTVVICQLDTERQHGGGSEAMATRVQDVEIVRQFEL